MSYHIISIDAAHCRISCSHRQLVLQLDNAEKRIPLEDVAAIIISSPSCTLSNTFIIEASKHRIGLILCDHYKPAALVLPVYRMTHADLSRKFLNLPTRTRQRLWEKTLAAKCRNQLELCKQWQPSHPYVSTMQALLAGAAPAPEAQCARLFWRVFAHHHESPKFCRGRFIGGYNVLFNYAYAVLLSCMLQYLLAYGLDPCWGIHHVERPQATPLAYDLMEPFRPIFDANVSRWILQQRSLGASEQSIATISTDYRQHITSTLLATIEYQHEQLALRAAIEAVVRSFRAAVLAQQIKLYQPWSSSCIVWAG